MALDTITIKDANDVDRKITTDIHTVDNHVEVAKVGFGAEDAAPTLVSPANPLPTVQTGALPAGTNNIGDVDVLTVPADPFGTNADAIGTPGAAGSISSKLRLLTSDLNLLRTELQNLTVAEDAAHVNGDTGIMAMGVRNDAGTVLAATAGDYIPLSMDANGYLRVNVAAGGTSGTQYADGTVNATPTGTAAMGRNPSNELHSLLLTALGNLKVAIEEGTVSLAGTQRIGYVGGFLETIRPTTTVNTTPYSAGDTLCGEIQLTNAMATAGGSGVLVDLNLTRENGAAFAFRVEVFDSNPASTSAINTPFVWGTGDKGRWLGEVVVAADDEHWSLIDSDSVINIRGINMGVDNAESSQHLYAHIITDSAVTLAVGDISMALKFIQN